MKKPRAPRPQKAAKPPRNPHARVLGKGPYTPKIEKGKDEYRRRPKHPKPPGGGETDG